MWIVSEEGLRLFRYGREGYDAAIRAAQDCSTFQEDVEDEWVTDEARSFYNCRYRRWTADSFQCQCTSK
jgi:hypothetical protein